MATDRNDAGNERPWWRLALWTVPVVLALGLVSGWLSNSGYSNGWFVDLRKPSFMPPGWAFGVVWTTLYILMGIAVAIVLAAPKSKVRSWGLTVFAVQLLLNFAWSPVFFGGGRIDQGMLIILALDVLVTIAVGLFWRVRPLAGALLLPYLAWLCLASALNWQIGSLNPGADQAPMGLTGG